MGNILFNRNIKEGWDIVKVTDSSDSTDMYNVLREYNNILLGNDGMLILYVDNGVDTDKYFITKKVRNIRIVGEAILKINYSIEPHQTWISKYVNPETTEDERRYMKEVYSKQLYNLNKKYSRVSVMQFGWTECEIMHRIASSGSGIPINGDDSDYVTLDILKFMDNNNYKLLYGNYYSFLNFVNRGFALSVYQICLFAEAIDFNEDILSDLELINNAEDYIQVITKYPYKAKELLKLNITDIYTIKKMLVLCESHKERYRYEDIIKCIHHSADYKECYSELRNTCAHNIHKWYKSLLDRCGLAFLYDASVWFHKMYNISMDDIISSLDVNYIMLEKDNYSAKQLIKLSYYKKA